MEAFARTHSALFHTKYEWVNIKTFTLRSDKPEAEYINGVTRFKSIDLIQML